MKTLFISTLISVYMLTYEFTWYKIPGKQAISQQDTTTFISGEQLFRKNCAVCHGIDLNGRPPAFPSLKEVRKKMTKEQIVALLKTGRNAMPSFVHLSDAEREALAGFLYGEKTKSAVQTSLTPAEQGRNLFVANCSQCHKLKPTDPRPPGQRNMGMIPPVLGGITQVLDFPRFERILNMGPCYMPSFTYLSPKAKNQIYIYLQAYEDSIPGRHGNVQFRNGIGCGGW